MATEKDKDKNDDNCECDDETPTVIFCPKCESTNITFIRCTVLCLACGHNW